MQKSRLVGRGRTATCSPVGLKQTPVYSKGLISSSFFCFSLVYTFRLAGSFVIPINSLLQDHETEVRAATIKDISSFVDLVGAPTFASEVMPYVLALLQDVNLVGVLKDA